MSTKQRLQAKVTAARQRARTARQLGRTQRTITVRRAGRMPAPRAAPASFFPMGSEIKAIDIATAGYNFRTPAAATNIILLNGIQTGSGFFNRVGSRVEMRNLHIRGCIVNGGTATQSYGRIIIVYDRQPTGALPTVADILQSRDQVGTATTSGSSEINLDFRDRFTIVRDMSFYLPAVTNAAGVLTNGPAFPGNDDQQFDINEFIKLKEMGTHFKSTSNPTTIADIATGALYALFVANASDSTWTANVGFCLRYHDN